MPTTPPPGTPTVNLTAPGNFGSVDDVVFAADQVQGAGTGSFPAFLQMVHSGTEQGYNSDARPVQFDETNAAGHNHSLLLANIPIVEGNGAGGTTEGLLYREFLLDANEGNGGDINQFLSLDRFQIWQEKTGNLTGFTQGAGFGAPGEHLVYNLDSTGDHWIGLNASLSAGSGQSDIRVLIPDFFFDHSIPFVYLYSAFGLQGGGWAANNGNEEWAIRNGQAGAGGGSKAALNIDKHADVPGGTADHAGEVITYTMTVANTGNVNLTGITVTDPSVFDLARGPDQVGNNDAVLNVGEIWSYTAHHTVTQADIDSLGETGIANTATADSDQTGPDTSSVNVPVDQHPHATLDKNGTVGGNGIADAAGDVIHYTIAVTNNGNTTLTDPAVTDSTINIVTPVTDGPVTNPNVQAFTPVANGDFNLGDTNENNVQDPGETFQYVYPGDIDSNGSHDPGETWSVTTYNLGDANNNGIHDVGEVWVGDTNQNGIEEPGERWQFKNLGDTNHNNLQDPGETWQYANVGDTNVNGVQDTGEVFVYRNVGDTNQNGVEDPGETFQFYNAGDTNHNGEEDEGETFQFNVNHSPTFAGGDTNGDSKINVGETWQYTFDYTLTQADIDHRNGNGVPTVVAGLTHDNTASVDTGQGASASDTVSIPVVQNPQVTLVKTASVPGGTADTAGEVISYTIDVTNTGNMTLTSPMVSDSSASNLNPVLDTGGFNTGDINHDNELDLGETWHYTANHTVTQADIDNRDSENVPTVEAGLTRDNTASVSTAPAQGASDSDTASVTIAQNPADSIQKTVTDVGGDGPNGHVNAAGDVISYTIAVHNTGNMTLTGATLTDPLLQGAHGTLSAPTESLTTNGELDVGETWTYTGTYTAQQSDIDNGGVVDDSLKITNIATADTAQTDPKTASASVPVDQQPDLDITKVADRSSVDAAGETINYTVTVDNAGNMTLTGITVTDPFVTNFTYSTGDTNGDSKLDLTETWTYTGSHTVTQAEMDAGGTINNTATADSAQTAPETASASVTVVQQPDLTIAKAANPTSADAAGDVINYTVTVDNVGNVTLTGVTVTDPLVTNLALTAGDANSDNKLDVTETWTYTGTHTVTQAEIDAGNSLNNTATADSDQTAPESASASVTLPPPPPPSGTAISIDDNNHLSQLVSGPPAHVGDLIQFFFQITNLTSTTLTSVAVTDTLGDIATPGNLQSPIPSTLAGNATFTDTFNHHITAADLSAHHVIDDITVTASAVQPATWHYDFLV
jgi:uncharacterized repeat protein (TIGR01451 family)